MYVSSLRPVSHAIRAAKPALIQQPLHAFLAMMAL